jgi:glycogen debranching enzyme
VRTLDALFPVLVSGNTRYLEAGFAELFDPAAFWRPRGPSGTAANEASYDPASYWRGDSWPQETYLMMVAAQRRGYHEGAHRLAEQLVLGCVASGYAERWNPETGGGLGAIPQSWAALASEGVRVLEAAGAPDGLR